MDEYRARDIIATIDEAISAWTLHVGTVPDEFTIGALAQHADRLARAASRLTTLAITRPDLTVGQLFPRSAVDVAELEEIRALSAAEIAVLTEPPPTVTLTVRAGQTPLLDEFDHHVRGAVCPVRVAQDGTQTLDLTDILIEALHFDPEAEERAALAQLAAAEDRDPYLEDDEDLDEDGGYDARLRATYDELRRRLQG